MPKAEESPASVVSESRRDSLHCEPKASQPALAERPSVRYQRSVVRWIRKLVFTTIFRAFCQQPRIVELISRSGGNFWVRYFLLGRTLAASRDRLLFFRVPAPQPREKRTWRLFAPFLRPLDHGNGVLFRVSARPFRRIIFRKPRSFTDVTFKDLGVKGSRSKFPGRRAFCISS